MLSGYPNLYNSIMHKYKILLLMCLLPGMSSCQWTEDNIGKHLPVAGERCSNWQCFTEEGKKASAEKQKQTEQLNNSTLNNKEIHP